jgi:hypothetical protein
MVGERTVVGFDRERIEEVLGLGASDSYHPEWEGLELGAVSDTGFSRSPEALPGQLTALLARIQREMEYNASKGASAYRFGQHDALRFARDALIRIAEGTEEPPARE